MSQSTSYRRHGIANFVSQSVCCQVGLVLIAAGARASKHANTDAHVEGHAAKSCPQRWDLDSHSGVGPCNIYPRQIIGPAYADLEGAYLYCTHQLLVLTCSSTNVLFIYPFWRFLVDVLAQL